MRALFILFIFGHIVSAQNSDIYKRPFQSKPDFDIDVLHYDINLKIYDHEKTFYGITSIYFKEIQTKKKFTKMPILLAKIVIKSR